MNYLIKIFIALIRDSQPMKFFTNRFLEKKPTLIKRDWIKCVIYPALFANYSGTALVSHDF